MPCAPVTAFVGVRSKHRRRDARVSSPASFLLLFLAALGLAPSSLGQPAPDEVPPAQARYFEERVRPLLAERCFECHGPHLDEVKGGLRLSGPAGLARGGDGGPAVVPGNPDASRLIRAVRYESSDLSMPPSDRLTDGELQTLERWVREGAPWPLYGKPEHEGASEPTRISGDTIQEGRSWWSFRPVARPDLPELRDPEIASLARSGVDRLVFAELERNGLKPNPPADRRELIRRAYFDLIGLPPSYQEVEEFVADPDPDAFDRVIDHLLGLPQYGERWGRHWLDVVRFAQTNGYERDTEKPYAWRYRDYVIDSFNRDKPYDRFVREQIAGDELADADSDSLVATGFYHLGPWDSEPDDPPQAELDVLDDMLRTTSEAFLGLTLGCARCHEHKFDPLPQEDYYGMLAFLRGVLPFEKPIFTQDSRVYTAIDPPQRVAAWERELERSTGTLRGEIDGLYNPARQALILGRLKGRPPEVAEAFLTPGPERTSRHIALLNGVVDLIAPSRREVLKTLRPAQRATYDRLTSLVKKIEERESEKLTWAMTCKEVGPNPKPTFVLHRGDVDLPGDRVPPSFPLVLCADDKDAVPPLPSRADGARTPGLRGVLARWVTSPHNPLTARVMANRVWQHLFGRGIVATPNDFGRSGLPPSHPLLLDYLASELVRIDWSLKRLQRIVMRSYVYQMSASAAADGVRVDEANALLWRQRLRRLDAEAIRDAALTASGELDLTPGGRGFFPRLSRQVLAGGSRPGDGWEVDDESATLRRSVYCYIKRSMIPPMLEGFDYSSPSLPVGDRPVTTIAPQSLILMNSEFMRGRAAAFAARVRREAGDDPAGQIGRAYRIALARDPSPREVEVARGYLAATREHLSAQRAVFVFAPRVPRSLAVSYLEQCQASDLVDGPSEGFSFHKGRWGGKYSDIVTVDPLHGPVAVLDQPVGRVGVLQTRFVARDGVEVGFLVAVSSDAEDYRGLEVRFDLERGEASLLLHDGEVVELANATSPLAAGAWTDLRIELGERDVRVIVDDDEMLRADHAGLLGLSGDRLAVRSLDGLLWVGPIAVDPPGDASGTPRVIEPPAIDADQGALEALCLVVLNLNEFVYLD